VYQTGYYGLAVLSRLPIISSDKRVLTSVDPARPRILVVWQLALEGGGMVEFANAHLGLDVNARATQAEEVLETLAGRERVVLLGDLNETPDGGTQKGALYSTFSAELNDAWKDAGKGEGYTFPAGTPGHRIDYVMLGTDWAPARSAHVIDSKSSDHRPLLVEVPLP
jgi:endonuclease/exonuclease/phosphatase family metal-dependent hydrolase